MSVPQAFLRREWLNPELSLHTSYIMAHIEDTRAGTNKCGSNLLFIADCNRVVQLEFYLGNETARRESLAKVNVLIEVLVQFREVLIQQADSIANVEKGEKTMGELIKFPSQRAQSKIRTQRAKTRTLRLNEQTTWQINDCLLSLVSIAAQLKSVLDKTLESKGV